MGLFDRSREDDPLAGLRGDGSPTVEVSEAGRKAGSVGGGGGGGIGEGPVLLVWFVLTLALTAFVLVRSEQGALSDPIKKAQRGEIKGFSPESLLRPERLAKALAKIEPRLGEGGYLL